MVATKNVVPLRKTKKVLVIRNRKTHKYEIEDVGNAYGLMHESTVLFINCADGREVYWPIDNITCWIVK